MKNPTKILLTTACALLAGSFGAYSQVIRTTGDGNGADAYVSNDAQNGNYQYNEVCATDKLIMRDSPNSRLKISMIRFEIPTNYVNFAGSTFSLYNTWLGNTTTARPIEVWGLKDGDPGENWVEGTITFGTAPGLIIGVTNGATWSPDTNRLVYLGQMPGATVESAIYTAAPAGLADFLAADTDGLVTFYMTTIPINSNGVEYETKEGSADTTQWPTLTMPFAIPNPNYPDLSWAGANGAWDINTTPNWFDGVGAANYQETSSYGNKVTFDDTASGSSPITITLDTTVHPQSVTVDGAKSYTITGTGKISGGAGISKSGSGTLTLSNTGFNDFVGAVDLNDGVLEFVTGALGTGTTPINFNGGTLRFGSGTVDNISSATVTFNADAVIEVQGADNPIMGMPLGNGGAGGLRKIGSGTLTLAGAHTYTGTTYVDAGKLNIAGATLDASPSIVVASGAELQGTGGALTLAAGPSQSLSGRGLVTAAVTVPAGTSISPGVGEGNTGTLTIGNPGVFDGLLTMDGGTLVIDISSSSNDVLVANNQLTLNSGTIFLRTNGVIANGTYTLVQYQNSLIGAAGAISISGFSQPGTVAFLDDSVPGKIDLIVAPLSSKTLTWVGDGGLQVWDVAGAANWTDGAASAFNHGDSVTFNDSGINSPDIALGALVFPSAFIVNNPTKDYRIYDSTFSGGGKVGGSVALTKSGAGKLTIDSPNSNSGGATINAGTVEVGTSGKLGTGAITNNAALIFGQSLAETHSSLTGTGTLAVNGTGPLTFAGGATHTGTTTIGVGANLVLGNGGSIGAINTSSITNDGTLTINSSDTLTAPAVTGAGVLAKSGSGTLNLGASGVFQGVTVNADGGSVLAGAANQVQGGLAVQANAKFDLNGFDQSVGGLNSTLFAGGMVTNSASTTNVLAVTANAANDASLAIHGNVQFVKLGTAELILRSDANTYTGGTIVGEGTLQGRGGSGSGFFGSGPITLSNSAAFQFDNYPVNELRVVAGAAATLRARALGDGYSGLLSSGNGASVLHVDNAISFGAGAGVAQFDGYTGTIHVTSNGTIRFAQSSSTVQNGGSNTTFQIDGTFQTRNGTYGTGITIGELTGTGSIAGPQSPPGNSTYVVGSKGTSSAFTGTIWGDVAGSRNNITKVGAGTLTLGGTNVFAGITRVDAGVLAFSGAAEANPSNTVQVAVNSPGTLNVSGLPGGTLYMTRNEDLTLSGNGTITGSVQVESTATSLTVAPGSSAGLLTISGSLTVPATTTFAMELDNTNSPTADRVTVGGTFTVAPGATVTVTNIGPMLVAGQIFKLFDAGVAGVTTVIATEDSYATYTFDDRIATAGEVEVLTVTPKINTTPENINWSIAGGMLSLNWTNNAGWILQSQTNSLSTGLSTNWVDVAGSESITSTNITVEPSSPTVFFRLRLP